MNTTNSIVSWSAMISPSSTKSKLLMAASMAAFSVHFSEYPMYHRVLDSLQIRLERMFENKDLNKLLMFSLSMGGWILRNVWLLGIPILKPSRISGKAVVLLSFIALYWKLQVFKAKIIISNIKRRTSLTREGLQDNILKGNDDHDNLIELPTSVEIMSEKKKLLSTLLTKSFYPFGLFASFSGMSGVLQSAFSALFRPFLFHIFTKATKLEEREEIPLEDGGTVHIDWYFPTFKHKQYNKLSSSPVVVIFPGTSGGSTESYMLNPIKHLTNQGYKVAVYIRRGCGGFPLTSGQLQRYGDVEEVDLIIKHVHNRYPDDPMLSLGFSLGACLMVKYLGVYANQTPIIGAVSIGNVFNLVGVSYHLQFASKSMDWVLRENEKSLIRSNYDILNKRLKIYNREECTLENGLRTLSYRELVRLVGCPNQGYETTPWCLNDYLNEGSCDKYVGKITIPLLILSAEDDPIVPIELIPIDTIKDNPYTVLALTRTGGHFAYLSWTFWRPGYMDFIVEEWLDAVLDAI